MKKKRLSFIMRHTSIVLVSVILFLSSSQVYAANVYTGQYVQEQQTESNKQIVDDESSRPLKRSKRVVPLVIWGGCSAYQIATWFLADTLLTADAFTTVYDEVNGREGVKVK